MGIQVLRLGFTKQLSLRWHVISLMHSAFIIINQYIAKCLDEEGMAMLQILFYIGFAAKQFKKSVLDRETP